MQEMYNEETLVRVHLWELCPFKIHSDVKCELLSVSTGFKRNLDRLVLVHAKLIGSILSNKIVILQNIPWQKYCGKHVK